MKILISGASGLIGSRLVEFLIDNDHEVVRLVRDKSKETTDTIFWDPYSGIIGKEWLNGIEAVVHLAGENIAERWTPAKKRRIRDSRVIPTRFLSEVLAGLDSPPALLVSASAIGYYGDRGTERLDEGSIPGSGFLSEVCQEWEDATGPAVQGGIRVVNLRIGVVLSGEGGALKRMLPPFLLGLGGKIGSGNQYLSWIALDEVVGAIHHAITTDSLRGPVNAVAPEAVTNRDFTSTLGRVLSRPTLFPIPAFVARLALGEMADSLLLASARVEPIKLVESGYEFRFPELDVALRNLLSRG
jgi:uncharacterized protein (TIGR01777 family)